jgi:hypothetical protein
VNAVRFDFVTDGKLPSHLLSVLWCPNEIRGSPSDRDRAGHRSLGRLLI